MFLIQFSLAALQQVRIFLKTGLLDSFPPYQKKSISRHVIMQDLCHNKKTMKPVKRW
jgi:hypothetical protein